MKDLISGCVVDMWLVPSGDEAFLLNTRASQQLMSDQATGTLGSAANRLIGEVVQSQRRPLLGPSPG